MKRELQRLGRLADDLQAVSRAEERQLGIRLESAPPAELVEAALRAAEPAYRTKNVALVSRVAHNLPALAADRDRMGEVLANLLENALRHTRQGGHVEISAIRSGSDIEIAVADDGDGLSPEDLERVFERFYRVDRARTRERGGGIGLTIARAIVEAHGGRIRAENEGPGCGARFIVSLPRA